MKATLYFSAATTTTTSDISSFFTRLVITIITTGRRHFCHWAIFSQLLSQVNFFNNVNAIYFANYNFSIAVNVWSMNLIFLSKKRFIPLFTVLENCTKSIIFKKYSFLHPKKFFWFLANSGYLKKYKKNRQESRRIFKGQKSDTFFRWFSNTVAYSFIR